MYLSGAMKTVSQKLADLMEGRTEWDDADEAIKSWARFTVYQVATKILQMPKEKRRAAIDRAPPSVRPHLENEISRVWDYRRKL